MRIKSAIAGFLLVCCPFAGAMAVSLPAVDHELRVSAESGAKRIVIDGNPVREAEMSRYFASSESKGRIRQAKIRVILSPHLRLEDYFNVMGILQMIGFNDVTYYVTSEDSEKMIEIKTAGQTVPTPDE